MSLFGGWGIEFRLFEVGVFVGVDWGAAAEEADVGGGCDLVPGVLGD